MATSKSDALRDLQLNALRGTAMPAMDVDVALFNATGELTGTGYARKNIPSTATAWNAPATVAGKRRITNAAVVDFGTAGSDWAPSTAPVVEVVLFYLSDVVGAAPIELYRTSEAADGTAISKIIQNGDPVRIPAGALAIDEGNIAP